jgi:tetratricopeptide (TPR) repeat protein
LARFRFAHALFQKYLYEQLGQGERRLLHSDVAGALKELHAGRLEQIASQMAWHYAEAGEEEKALPFLIQSGDKARTLYAFEEAATQYDRALAILKRQGLFYEAARILMKLGLSYHNAFNFEKAHQTYQDSLNRWQQAAREPALSLPSAPHSLRLPAGEPVTLDPALSTDTSSADVGMR